VITHLLWIIVEVSRESPEATMHGFSEDYGIVKYYQYRQAMYPLQWQVVETRRSPKSPDERPLVLIHPNLVRITLTVTIVSLVCASIVMLVSSL
jgi:hypothetical protein